MAQPIERITPQDAEPVDRAVRLEVLVRLVTERGDVVMPTEFLPHAERYGLLPQVDQWVCTHVCEWLAAHPAVLGAVTKVALNISGQSLGDLGFRQSLLDYLKRTSVPLTKLCFEITESEAISNRQAAIEFFDQLRHSGASVCLDDFGTGLSSFEYLKDFHVDYLKIDGMFVRSLERNSHDYAIVKAIQSVAAAMQIETVAEYAENDGIVACLCELGVHYAQGYAFGKPMPLSDLLELPVSHRFPSMRSAEQHLSNA